LITPSTDYPFKTCFLCPVWYIIKNYFISYVKMPPNVCSGPLKWYIFATMCQISNSRNFRQTYMTTDTWPTKLKIFLHLVCSILHNWLLYTFKHFIITLLRHAGRGGGHGLLGKYRTLTRSSCAYAHTIILHCYPIPKYIFPEIH
jgi:hypothetical protein